MDWLRMALYVGGGLLALLLLTAVVGGILIFRWTREFPSRPETVSPSGEPKARALIVYHPGGSGFSADGARWIAEGLASEGWEVHLDRANSRTESDLASYDLLVVGSPIYAGKVHPPVMRYVERCSGLEGKSAAVYTTSGGESVPDAVGPLVEALEKKDASIAGTLSLVYPRLEQRTAGYEFGKKLSGGK